MRCPATDSFARSESAAGQKLVLTLRRALFLASNDGYFYKGYGEIFRRFFLSAKEAPLHPSAA